MSGMVTIPESITPYAELAPATRKRLDDLVSSAAADDATRRAVYAGLVDYGGDAVLLVAFLSAMQASEKVASGFGAQVLEIVTKPGSRVRSASPPKQKPKRPARPKRVLPGRMPKPSETREEFLKRFAEDGPCYPADMLDWTTGEINWQCAEVYGYARGTLEWFLYAALVLGPRRYDDLFDLDYAGRSLKEYKRDADYALKRLAVEPSWLPPGAGVWSEDMDAGTVCIARDPAASLHETLPWVRHA